MGQLVMHMNHGGDGRRRAVMRVIMVMSAPLMMLVIFVAMLVMDVRRVRARGPSALSRPGATCHDGCDDIGLRIDLAQRRLHAQPGRFVDAVGLVEQTRSA